MHNAKAVFAEKQITARSGKIEDADVFGAKTEKEENFKQKIKCRAFAVNDSRCFAFNSLLLYSDVRNCDCV